MFINERFPPDISFDAKESVRHSTDAIQVKSGRRSANKNWAFPLREFDVSHAARIKSYADQLLAFNLAVAQGMANTFRFKAWGDYKVLAGQGVFTTITSSTYQMARRYTFGGTTIDRPIYLPVTAKTTIFGPASYAFDETTGIVTRTGGSGDPTSWIGEFDVRCYMAVDLADFVIKDKSGGDFIVGADSITLMEDR